MDATLDEHGEARSRDPDVLARGDLLGRYVVLGRIGAGGMGAVYAAYDPDLDRKVAIKLLHAGSDGASAGSTSGGPKRLLREAQALAKLAHGNVVTVHDVGEHRGRVFVAMEFIAGRTVTGWIAQERPRWHEVLEVYLRAGRGLAAIHSADLVHRDFKPDNVMVGADGRVLVMDLGLARRIGVDHDDARLLESRMRPAMEVLATPMTQAGAILGTPAYMAPEQHLGLACTARTDQFSFCVALFEGLFGSRPFTGDTVASLALAVTRGRVAQPSGRTPVPNAIRRAVLRGLRPDDAERWPDMPALLHALEKALAASRRRPWIAGVAATVVAGGLAIALHDEADVCGGAEQRLSGVWDDQRREAVVATLGGLGAIGSQAALRVVPVLDEYALALTAAHRDACEATEVRREQSVDTRELRLACLSDRVRELDALVRVLVEADAKVAERAYEAAESLPLSDRCADLEYLRARVKPPDDAALAQRVEELRDTLAEGRALEHAGKYEAALAVTVPAAEEAESTGYGPLRAEASILLGNLQDGLGRIEPAEQAYQRAYFAAESSGADELAIRAALRLADVLTHGRVRFEAAEVWIAHAAAKAERTGSEVARGEVASARGGLLETRGDYPGARAQLEEAVALLRAQERPPPEIATTLARIGIVCETIGELACAREKYEEALAIWQAAVGDEHPHVAQMLDALAIVAGLSGDPEESRRLHERAIAIWERSLGPDNPSMAVGLANLGQTLRHMGELEEARDAFERASAIWVKSHGPRHPNVAKAAIGLGVTLVAMGDADAAIVQYERALEILRETLGPDHDVVAAALSNLANALQAAGQPEEARKKARAAAEIFRARLGENHPNTATALFVAAASSYELEQYDEALIDAKRGRAIQVALHGERSAQALSTEGFVCGLLWDTGERAEGERRCAVVREEAERGGEVEPQSVASAWLVLALSLREAGREAEARAAGECALNAMRQPKDASTFGDIAFALARSLGAKRRAEAIALAREGLTMLEAGGRGRSRAATRIRDWLRRMGAN